MTRLEFLLKTFATNTEQMKVTLDTQQTIVDTLVDGRDRDHSQDALKAAIGDLNKLTESRAQVFEAEPTKVMLIPEVLESAGWVRKKEWVGLTDEEMESVYRSIYGAGTEHENLVEMGRATEVKLRGKNGY